MNAVLELNDQSLRLYTEGGLLFSSPGYVLAEGKTPQFGEQAASQSRLHPVKTNNEFWHYLGMNTLPRPMAHYRHYADIAHAHLLYLAEQSGYSGPVLLAVPGSYDRQQLAVLSGILQHSPFTGLALVDAALLAVNRLPAGKDAIYLDLQLHQALLTRLHADQQQLRREAVQAVPGAGWDNVSNFLVQVINDAFIEQCRFNPEHSAVWEQQLYNELPDYLQRLQQGEQELRVVIDTGTNRHEARITPADLMAELEPIYRRIGQQIQSLADSQGVMIVVSEHAERVPGLVNSLGVSVVAGGDQLGRHGLRLASELPEAGAQLPYITRIALDQATAEPSVAETDAGRENESLQRPTPTHILLGYQARMLGKRLWLKEHNGHLVVQEEVSGDVLCCLEKQDEGQWVLQLQPAGQGSLLINDKPVTASSVVYAGDRLSLTGFADTTGSLIQVLAD